MVNEALRQVALADILLLNKTDLVTDEELDAVYKRIRYVIVPLLMVFVMKMLCWLGLSIAWPKFQKPCVQE